MELNLLIGGPGRPGRPAQPDARRAGRSRLPHAARRGERQDHAGGRLHHRAQPRPDGEDRRLPARRRVAARDRPGLARRPAHHPGRPRHHALRRAPRPDRVPAARAGHHAAVRRRGHRQRRRRGARVRALPDPPRRQGDQGVGVGRRDVAQHRARRAAVLRRGVRRDRRRGAPRRRARRRARRGRHRDPGLHPGRHRLHRARLPGHRRHHPDDGRPRHVPRVDHVSHRGDGHRPHRAGTAQEGRGGLPAGEGDAAQGDRRRRADRLRHRRAGDPARPERQGARAHWSTGA